jgi:hypothetical protein
MILWDSNVKRLTFDALRSTPVRPTGYGVERFDRKRSRHIFLQGWMAGSWDRQQYAEGLFRPTGRYRLEQGKAS